MKENKAVYILAIEAKDIYNSNNLLVENGIGYTAKNKNGDLLVDKKFTNSLDFSLDLMKMRELYEKVYRKSDFTFNVNERNYTGTAICVNFSYSHKEFNRVGANVYVKAGYTFNQLEFIDNVAIINNELVGIVINTKVECKINQSLLGEYFSFEDEVYKENKSIKTLLTKAKLRDDLYHNGFICDGIKYVRFKRSSGSSRVGKCLFIDEKLYKRFYKWDLCGLKIKAGDEIDLAAFEAYISLPSSSIIDTICLEPKNFLVIDDYDSVFEDTAIGVGFVDETLTASEQKITIHNSLFDGESLLDSSLFAGKYSTKSMLLLRNRFFKSACFNSNIQMWFKDNSITDISQLNGFTLATDIKDIKIITTASSIKYVKFAPLRQWFKNLDSTFGIVKYDKPTPYFDGRMVQSHYQLLNTLQLSNSDIGELIKPNLDYISLIRSDPDVLKYHIKYSYNQGDVVPLYTKNEITYKLLGLNSKFSETKLYYDFRNDLVKSLRKNLKRGHVLINGNYSTLLGNGVEMLQHSIGTFNGESVIGMGNIYCKNFKFGETILGSRSPHINSGNILLAKNVQCDLIDQYFNLSKEIVYINAIGENIQQRLNGCDYDSDQILITNEEILVKSAEKNYHNFKVPTSMIKAKKVKRYYNDKDKSDLDIKTSVNKIGEIVNFSQYLNSIMWDNINSGQSVEQNSELYYDICKLAVLSGIEIDRAKKEYTLSSAKILDELKKKYRIVEDEKFVKPMFFKMITMENGFKLNEKHSYKYFKTPMDFLQKQISSFNFRKNRNDKEEFLPFSDMIKIPNMSLINGKKYAQRDRILSLVTDLKEQINSLFVGYNLKSKDEKKAVLQDVNHIKETSVKYINDLTISEATMYLLLKSLDDPQYKNITKHIYSTLFGTPNKVFFKMITESPDSILKLVENDYGVIDIFGFNFVKILKRSH